MNAEICKAHKNFARPLNTRERGALDHLRGEPPLADCTPLIDALLAANQKLEQEAVRVETILCEIRERTKDLQIE